LVLLGAGNSRAQDPPRFEETVLVTPAAAPVSMETLTRQAIVLDQETIRRLPARSAADLLS
jgi:hypothetical protein